MFHEGLGTRFSHWSIMIYLDDFKSDFNQKAQQELFAMQNKATEPRPLGLQTYKLSNGVNHFSPLKANNQLFTVSVRNIQTLNVLR